MINYNLNQNNANPNPNNYCGGYALAAILNSVNNVVVDNPPPMPVYTDIQNQQNGIGVNSQAFINQTIQNATQMSLPSSIAMCAHVNYGLNPTIFYNQQMLNQLLPVLNEEIIRLNAAIIQHQNIQNNLAVTLNQLQEFRLFIIFVNNTHWLAVERNNTNFRVYDPAQTFPTGNVVINNNNINQFAYSGVIIAFP